MVLLIVFPVLRLALLSLVLTLHALLKNRTSSIVACVTSHPCVAGDMLETGLYTEIEFCAF